MSTKLSLECLFIIIIIGLCCSTFAQIATQDYRNKISNYFRNYTYNARTLVSEIPTEVWNTFERNIYDGGSRLKLEELLNSGRSIPERAQSLIREAVITKYTEAEKIERLRSTNSEFEIFKLCEGIPPASRWTSENITRNWSFLKKCPASMFLEIYDRLAIDALLSQLQREREMKYKMLAQEIFVKRYGEPSSWTEENFRTLELTEDFLPYYCMEMNGNILATRQSDVLSRISRLSTSEREPCVKKFVEIVGLREASSASEARTKMNEIRQIQGDLMPNDFHPNVQNDNDIASILDRNIKQKLEEGYLRPDGALRILRIFGNISYINSDTVRNQGICALSLALPSQLHEASVKNLYSLGDIDTIVKCINRYKGPGADEKYHIFAERLVNDSDYRRPLSVSRYPAEVLKQFGYREWIRVEPTEARQILAKPINGTPQELGRLIDRMTKGDIANVYPFVREILPYSLLNEITQNEAVRILNGVQPGSTVALKAAEKFMESQNDVLVATDVSRLTILPYLGAAQADRFNQNNILEIFKAMGPYVKLTMPAAMILRKKFDNFTADVSSSFQNDPINFISGYDVENIPISVLCSFSPLEISRLSSSHKKVLLKRLGLAEEIDFRCPRNVRMAIVLEGSNAMGSTGGIQPTDVEIIGNALPDAPPDGLRNSHKIAKPKIIKKLNDMIDMKRVKPCWDSTQRLAVQQMIRDVYGSDLSSWDTIRPFACLLYTFNEEDLQMIRPEVFASESCESRTLFPSDLCLQAICNGSLGEYEFMRMQMAEQSFINQQRLAGAKVIEAIYENRVFREENGTRKKREATHEDINKICDKASYGGANAFTESELQQLDRDTLLTCLNKLGRYPMDERRASILARKIVDNNLIRSRDNDIFMKMKYIWTGYSDQTIAQSLEDWTAPYDLDIVDMISKISFSREQTRALATKLRREMGYDLKSQNSTEIQMISPIICGFASNILSQINVSAVRDALPGLSMIANCSNREALEQLFKAVQTSVGAIERWTASDIMQFGVIFAGIMPEDWTKINPIEMEGVSPLAVREFTGDIIRSMNGTHIEYMTPCALAAFTDEQKRNFSNTMRQALERNQRLTQKRNNVEVIEIQNALMIILFSLLTVIPYWASS